MRELLVKAEEHRKDMGDKNVTLDHMVLALGEDPRCGQAAGASTSSLRSTHNPPPARVTTARSPTLLHLVCGCGLTHSSATKPANKGPGLVSRRALIQQGSHPAPCCPPASARPAASWRAAQVPGDRDHAGGL